MNIRLINTDKPTGMVTFLPAGGSGDEAGGKEVVQPGASGSVAQVEEVVPAVQEALAGELPAAGQPVPEEVVLSEEDIFSAMKALHSIERNPPSEKDKLLISIAQDNTKPIIERMEACKNIKFFDALNENLAKLSLEVIRSQTGQKLNNIKDAIELASKILDQPKRDKTCQKIARLFVVDQNDPINEYVDQFTELFELITYTMSTENKCHLIGDILRNNEEYTEFYNGITQLVLSFENDKALLNRIEVKSARNI